METISKLELLLVLATIGILLIYHTFLAYKVRRKPLETSIGITNHLRMTWALTIMQERRDVLAVQTLRNWIMASSFLASTAMLICLGILNTAIKPPGVLEISHALNLFGTQSETLWLVKMLLLVIIFFFSFFNFTLSIRYFNHASFGLGIPEQTDKIANHEFMAHVINTGSFHYTLGMRGYYLSIPFGLWLFGPVWMFAGTVVLLFVLHKLDRTA